MHKQSILLGGCGNWDLAPLLPVIVMRAVAPRIKLRAIMEKQVEINPDYHYNVWISSFINTVYY